MDGPEDFDAFYTATARRVVHHVYALCGDLAEAQDVTQEAYARAWQRWSTVGAYEDPEGWVRTVAWRLTANRWRGLRRWFAARARLGRETPTPGPNRTGWRCWRRYGDCPTRNGWSSSCTTSTTCRWRRSPGPQACGRGLSSRTCPGAVPRSPFY
ncbi:sigma-70 region 2 domain protein [Micromonospora aurantiaca ATCC 27029]|nr:sigma-70 region 2 domain protein [Micromonospora aurantiaca ATCC 27029]